MLSEQDLAQTIVPSACGLLSYPSMMASLGVCLHPGVSVGDVIATEWSVPAAAVRGSDVVPSYFSCS